MKFTIGTLGATYTTSITDAHNPITPVNVEVQMPEYIYEKRSDGKKYIVFTKDGIPTGQTKITTVISEVDKLIFINSLEKYIDFTKNIMNFIKIINKATRLITKSDEALISIKSSYNLATQIVTFKTDDMYEFIESIKNRLDIFNRSFEDIDKFIYELNENTRFSLANVDYNNTKEIIKNIIYQIKNFDALPIGVITD